MFSFSITVQIYIQLAGQAKEKRRNVSFTTGAVLKSKRANEQITVCSSTLAVLTMYLISCPGTASQIFNKCKSLDFSFLKQNHQANSV